eukprot:TRINITY_DN1333_c0_g1_i11.p2 TRINITY_DN1333_c0_g1~~TRINITY_DN1333_c0_g1_i11.p2  ORF type:complete len:126 (+),score=14.93 TRINITY_DN1333_c0_g1_i11:134-511(+)
MCIRDSYCHCPCGPCKNISFKIFRPNDLDHHIGEITKQWSGCMKELLSNADNFGLTFPKEIDWREKLVLMTCVLFIDYRYFEEKNDEGNKGVGIGAQPSSLIYLCLLYTSPSPRDLSTSRMPSSA